MFCHPVEAVRHLDNGGVAAEQVARYQPRLVVAVRQLIDRIDDPVDRPREDAAEQEGNARSHHKAEKHKQKKEQRAVDFDTGGDREQIRFDKDDDECRQHQQKQQNDRKGQSGKQQRQRDPGGTFGFFKVGKQYVNIVVCLLAAAVLILSALMISQNQKFSKRFSAQEEELRNLSEAAALLEEKNTTVQSDNQIENQVADEPTAPEPSFDTVSFVRYTVEQGDTIYTICAKYNISYNDNYALIVGINGLKNPDSIYIGQQLMIPLD